MSINIEIEGMFTDDLADTITFDSVLLKAIAGAPEQVRSELDGLMYETNTYTMQTTDIISVVVGQAVTIGTTAWTVDTVTEFGGVKTLSVSRLLS
jgi:hypothetical protein